MNKTGSGTNKEKTLILLAVNFHGLLVLNESGMRRKKTKFGSGSALYSKKANFKSGVKNKAFFTGNL